MILWLWLACASPADDPPVPPTAAAPSGAPASPAAPVPEVVPPRAPIAEVTTPTPPIAEVAAPRPSPEPGAPIPGLQIQLPARLAELPPLPGPDPRACKVDADCEVSCTPMNSCCGSPCGCRSAYNHEGAARMKAHVEELCPRVERDCPAVACAREDARAARCEAGRCVASDAW